ncbi:MAG: hypothetical protein E6I28_12035 [Chloroflexi bacterium]|nr:MAG: hypothetical protein E6I28_12035 [Chloroflexota bacterium]
MAGALRPVVVLMLFASILFLLAGVLDGAYPGGPSWFTGTAADFSILSYLFAFVNTVVALFVARGSERSLVARIGLAGFFVLERPLSAFIFGEKPIASVGTHLLTAAVELIILISAVRVWRLGHSLAARDVDVLFSLEGPSPAAPPEPARRRRERPNQAALRPGTAWLIAVVTLILAIILVADGAYEGFVPGGREWSTADNAGWVVYLFAAVTLTIAVRAVHGGRIALRALMVVALILFLERSFSPFSLREQDPVVLALHGLAALVSLAVALATASAIRGRPPREPASVQTLEAA